MSAIAHRPLEEVAVTDEYTEVWGDLTGDEFEVIVVHNYSTETLRCTMDYDDIVEAADFIEVPPASDATLGSHYIIGALSVSKNFAIKCKTASATADAVIEIR